MGIEIKQVSGHEELERWVATRNEVVPDVSLGYEPRTASIDFEGPLL